MRLTTQSSRFVFVHHMDSHEKRIFSDAFVDISLPKKKKQDLQIDVTQFANILPAMTCHTIWPQSFRTKSFLINARAQWNHCWDTKCVKSFGNFSAVMWIETVWKLVGLVHNNKFNINKEKINGNIQYSLQQFITLRMRCKRLVVNFIARLPHN